jgi:hypothetical protein
MGGQAVLQYQVAFTREPETLDRSQAMATFHLDCLIQEGKPVPTEEREEAGFYLRVKLPP